jgi:lysine 2,3-aminomutase
MSKIVCISEKIKSGGAAGGSAATFPERWPGEYRRLAESLGPASPLLALGTARPEEDAPDAEAFDDPTGEARFSPAPFLHRKYRDRALLLVTSRCGFYCRFCFRRGIPPGEAREPGAAALAAALEWIGRTPEIREVILSGGDPLTLPDDRLGALSRAVGEIPHVETLRVHTRIPVTEPGRVTAGLLDALSRAELPVRLVLHAAHPAEVRPALARAAARLRRAGIALGSQTVLLSGINDDPAILGELFRRLDSLGIVPRYLHHPDRARGNARFRLTLSRGLAVYNALGEDAPIPPYVVELPDGSGKAPVASLAVEAEERRGSLRRLRYRWTRPVGWDTVGGAARFSWWDVWGKAG